ncbi:hypothetical protein ACWD3Z_42970 [Streptomyces sp. NPDC002740]
MLLFTDLANPTSNALYRRIGQAHLYLAGRAQDGNQAAVVRSRQRGCNRVAAQLARSPFA